jgi:hypothetical protein
MKTSPLTFMEGEKMIFFTDHYFQIGHAHYTAGKPCQDHALSRSSGSIACAIVSDGCSTGGNTDVGSRVLTFGTLQAIRDHAKASNGSLATAKVSILSRQQQLIGVMRPVLGLDRGDMLATCIYAYFSQSGGMIQVYGDGVIAWKDRNGDIFMHRYEWADNAPFYPSYEGLDLQAFINHHGGDLEAVRLIGHSAFGSKESGYVEVDSTDYTLQQGINGISMEISESLLEQIEFLAVFSDGVTQIDGVDWKDAVGEFLAFKTSAGEFAKRRMIRGIRDMQCDGRGPIDDISYAVIHVDQEKVQTEESQ